MNRVHIVVDSTANIPESVVQRTSNLHVVPIKIILGDQVCDETELTFEEIFEFVEPNKAFPKTSQPAPGEFARVFDEIVDAGCDAVVLTLSSAVSGTHQCAQNIARNYPKGRVQVVDSRSAGIGLWHLVEHALEFAEKGLSADEIVAKLLQLIDKNDIYILPATLEYLHKGGRIGGASAFIGSLLQMKPLLTVEEGKVAVLDKVRTHSRALQRMIDELPSGDKINWIGLTHTDSDENAAALAKRVSEATGVAEVAIAKLGASLSVHFGPGAAMIVLERV